MGKGRAITNLSMVRDDVVLVYRLYHDPDFDWIGNSKFSASGLSSGLFNVDFERVNKQLTVKLETNRGGAEAGLSGWKLIEFNNSH